MYPVLLGKDASVTFYSTVSNFKTKRCGGVFFCHSRISSVVTISHVFRLFITSQQKNVKTVFVYPLLKVRFSPWLLNAFEINTNRKLHKIERFYVSATVGIEPDVFGFSVMCVLSLCEQHARVSGER